MLKPNAPIKFTGKMPMAPPPSPASLPGLRRRPECRHATTVTVIRRWAPPAPRPDIATGRTLAGGPSGQLPRRRFGNWVGGWLAAGANKRPPAAYNRQGNTRRASWLRRSPACAVLFGASFLCAVSGGAAEPQRTAALSEAALPGPPQNLPLSSDAECIRLHDGTCVSVEEFDARAQGLARDHADDVQFEAQWGLGSIGADRAYAHVDLLEGTDSAPGAGVTIGLIDTGIDRFHPLFAGAIVSEVLLEGAADETGIARSSHGTAVASIAAGRRNLPLPSIPHGVAWGADIAMFAIPLGVGDGTYTPISLAGLARADAHSAQDFNQALAWRDGQRRVDILNLSFGYKGLIADYSEADLRASLPATIAALAQDGAGEKAILVWAAGNSNANTCDPSVPNCETGVLDAVSPSVMAGLAARIPELQGHTVAVVALAPADEIPLKPSDETIASFSNRCGVAAVFCIAAPGTGVRYAYFGPHPVTGAPVRSVGTGGGTSFAAPMVSGGIAIMKQLFRDQLANEELVTRLLETADNTGVFSDRAVYGRGKLDLAAATHPVGVLELPFGPHVSEAGYGLGTTHLSLGAPFGTGLGLPVLSHEIMALDDLGAPFWYRLGDFIAPAGGPAEDTAIWGFLANSPGRDPWRPGAWTLLTSGDTAGGHLSLADGGTMATVASRQGLAASVFRSDRRKPGPGAAGGALGWRPEGAPLGLRVGWVSEHETILGGAARGAFGAMAADTVFVRLEGDVRFGAWRLGAGAEWGSVRPQAQGGIIERISDLTTSAFALRARTALPNRDLVSVSLSQPLRVENGRASLTLPVARSKRGRVVHTSVDTRLAPNSRQIDLAVTWEKPLAGGPLRLGFIWSHDPGHSGSEDPRLTFLAGWRRTF